MADRDYAKELADAARPSGDFPVPEAGVTRVPDEVAQPDTFQAANDAILGRLTEQARPAEAQADGGGEATERATPRKASSRRATTDDE